MKVFSAVSEAYDAIDPVIITSVLTTDDGMITAHPENGGFMVRKYDPNGSLLWNKFIEDTNAGALPWLRLNGNLCRDAAGGAFLAIGLQNVEADMYNVDPDTSLCRVLIAHVAADGNIDARIVARTIVDAHPEPYDLQGASFGGLSRGWRSPMTVFQTCTQK